MATGKIKAVRREGNDLFVDAEIVAPGVGTLPVTVKVMGSITDAPEEARETIRALGADLAKSFDSPRTLL